MVLFISIRVPCIGSSRRVLTIGWLHIAFSSLASTSALPQGPYTHARPPAPASQEPALSSLGWLWAWWVCRPWEVGSWARRQRTGHRSSCQRNESYQFPYCTYALVSTLPCRYAQGACRGCPTAIFGGYVPFPLSSGVMRGVRLPARLVLSVRALRSAGMLEELRSNLLAWDQAAPGTRVSTGMPSPLSSIISFHPISPVCLSLHSVREGTP